MPSLTITREWARVIVACEKTNNPSRLDLAPVTLLAYEKLRRQLRGSIGLDGFRALASAALTLAKSGSPELNVLEVTTDGSLHGFDELELQLGGDRCVDLGVTLIAQLMSRVVILLGEETTLLLINDQCLQASLQFHSGRENVGGCGPHAPESQSDYDGLRREIDRLTGVSESLEIMAPEHVGLEAGLVTVSRLVRTVATLLDLFTSLSAQPDTFPEEAPEPSASYLM